MRKLTGPASTIPGNMRFFNMGILPPRIMDPLKYCTIPMPNSATDMISSRQFSNTFKACSRDKPIPESCRLPTRPPTAAELEEESIDCPIFAFFAKLLCFMVACVLFMLACMLFMLALKSGLLLVIVNVMMLMIIITNPAAGIALIAFILVFSPKAHCCGPSLQKEAPDSTTTGLTLFSMPPETKKELPEPMVNPETIEEILKENHPPVIRSEPQYQVKTVTSRWPTGQISQAELVMPTM